MTTRRTRGQVLAACAFVLSAMLLGSVSAQAAHAEGDPTPTVTPAVTPTAEPTASPTQSSTFQRVHTPFALTISPTRLTVGPTDATGTHTILVVNRGEATIHVNVLKQSFTGARDGSMSFSSRAPYSAANWVHVAPASFELAPGRSQNVVVSIVVPPNPDLGDHQLAIVFLVPAGTSTSNIRINRGVATPVYITVPGITSDTAQVSNLAAPAFSAGGPVRVTAQIHDSGTVHRDFRGTTALAIRGTASTTFPDFTVVRGSTRKISSLWNPPVFCVCQLSVAITNANGVSTSKTVQVIVFPVLAASIILGVLIALAFLILFNKRRLRRREARIAAGRHSFGSRGDD